MIEKYGSKRGFSLRSLRRFIAQHNLLNKIKDTELNDVVAQVIAKVGPSYGRRMLTGTLKSININACEGRVSKAAIKADLFNHNLRLQVKKNK